MRRWPLYVLTTAVVLGLEAAFAVFVHVKAADVYASLVGGPLIAVVVMVNVAADAGGTLPTAGERWSRILERAWIVIVIDVGISFLQIVGDSGLRAGVGAGNLAAGLLLLLFSGMLVYAEPFVCAESEMPALRAIPLALLRSLTLAWSNISRIFGLLAVQIGVLLAEGYLLLAVTPHVRNTTLYVDLPFAAIATALLAALFTVAYLDTYAAEESTEP